METKSVKRTNKVTTAKEEKVKKVVSASKGKKVSTQSQELADVQLRLALKGGKFEEIRQALLDGADVTKLDVNMDVNYMGYDMPIISALVCSGDLDLVKETIAAGADVNKKNSRDITPLMYAVQPIQGPVNIKMVKALVEAGADVKARRKTDYVDESVLTRASIFATVDVIRYLVENGASKTLYKDDIKEYADTISAKDLDLYKQAENASSNFRTNSKGVSIYLARKIRAYREKLAVLNEAYEHAQSRPKKAAKQDKGIEV